MILKPFSKQQDVSKQRAASEAAPIEIPFQHPDYLGETYSKGTTDKCFFLKAKATGEIFPYNQSMAESGNVHYLPYFDLDLLNDPANAGTVAVWRKQGVLPKGYGEVIADVKAVEVAKKQKPKPTAQAVDTTDEIKTVA